jgi:hypothetical protein
MQSFFYLVLSHPEVYKRLEAEIVAAEKEGKLSEMVQFSEGQALPYFQACLNEAMRIRPALGLDYQRFVPKEGATIDGKFYHGGMRASLNAWALHRDEKTWGKDADVFRPERWLNGDAKALERNMYQVSIPSCIHPLCFLFARSVQIHDHSLGTPITAPSNFLAGAFAENLLAINDQANGMSTVRRR